MMKKLFLIVSLLSILMVLPPLALATTLTFENSGNLGVTLGGRDELGWNRRRAPLLF